MIMGNSHVDWSPIIVMLPWWGLGFYFLIERFVSDWKQIDEYREQKKARAQEYDCLFPDDPCSAEVPVFGVECDNCVRWSRAGQRAERKELRKMSRAAEEGA